MPASAPELSVLIVSHGHDELLPACVSTLARALVAEAIDAEILLLDNLGGSLSWTLDSVSLPLRLFANPRPMGLSANVNRLAREARGRRLLVLNPDTEYIDGDITRVLGEFDHRPEVGVIAAQLVYPDGSVQPSYRCFPSLPQLLARGLGADRWAWQPAFYRRRMMIAATPLDKPTVVDWAFGAFLLVDAKQFCRLGGMDEGFRLYYEDVDLCRRARLAGLRTLYYPALRFRHVHMRTSASRPFSRIWRWHVASALRYFAKTLRRPLRDDTPQPTIDKRRA